MAEIEENLRLTVDDRIEIHQRKLDEIPRKRSERVRRRRLTIRSSSKK